MIRPAVRLSLAPVALLMTILSAAAAGQEAEPVDLTAPAVAAPRSANVGGPLADVPEGQIAVVYVPQAARVMAEIDRQMTLLHQDAAGNPLRQLVTSLALNQPLGAESAITWCLCPGDGRPARATLVTSVDVEAVVRGGMRDAAGTIHRGEAPAAMVVGPGAVIIGDTSALPNVARAIRGVRLSGAEREALADADVMVRVDLALVVSQWEPAYRAAREALAARLAAAQKTGAAARDVALAEERVRAVERLWARAKDVTSLAGGLVINRRGLDVRLCAVVAPGPALAEATADHPPLAGELSPPLPKQEFAALGYASFDPARLAKLLQWATGVGVDCAAAFGGENTRLGAMEIRDLRDLFSDLGGVLGERLGFIVPIRPSEEPVLQVDAVVQLKDAASGPMWRGLVPGKLDALAYLARCLWTPAAGGPTMATELEPASPNADVPIDLWRFTMSFPPLPDDGGVSAAQRTADAVLGSQGLSLWNMAFGGWGYVSVAPDSGRIPAMVLRVAKPSLGQAGEDAQTTEALRHVLRRSNAVVVFSPNVLAQLVSRTILKGLGAYGRTSEEIPLVEPGNLAALSVRLSGDNVAARLFVPAGELEPIFSLRRTLGFLDGVPAAPKITVP